MKKLLMLALTWGLYQLHAQAQNETETNCFTIAELHQDICVFSL